MKISLTLIEMQILLRCLRAIYGRRMHDQPPFDAVDKIEQKLELALKGEEPEDTGCYKKSQIEGLTPF